ncbi:transposase [Bradyrhizobium sp. NBAIM03]|nr:transposase [Bradyrhizobium sp. NBAIM03]
MFWVLRAGAPWRDLPERYGPYTTAYNRLQPLAQSRHLEPADGCGRQGTRWQGADDRQFGRAGPSACFRGEKKSGDHCVGRSRGGLTTKIHARVDAKGRPVRLMITPGEAHDVTCAEALLDGLRGSITPLEIRQVVAHDPSPDVR